MKKIDATVLKETVYIAVGTLILSMLMQSVFLIIDKWTYTVLLGNLLGYIAAVGNFFLLGLTVQKAVQKEEKEAKNLMKISSNARLFLMFIVAIIAYLIPVFNIIAVVITFLFPRLSIAVRPVFMKKE